MNNLKKEPNFWLRGKLEQRSFYDIKLNRSTSALTFIYGLLLAGLIIIPIGLLVFQFLTIYVYNFTNYFIFLFLIWIGIMLFNAFSNYFTVKVAQASVKDMINLQNIKAKYIFFYQLLNIGFAIFTLLILIFFGLQFMGAV